MQFRLFDNVFLDSFGVRPEDDESTRLKKGSLARVAFLFIIAGLLWGLMYFSLGQTRSGLVPFLYGVFSFVSMLVFAINKDIRFFRFSQLLLILILPSVLMFSLGGFMNSSAVIIWAFICPLGALVFSEPKTAHRWFLGFVSLVILSGLIQPYLAPPTELPVKVITFFFVANILAVSALIFFMVRYFILELDKERSRSNQLLLNVLPKDVIPLLKVPEWDALAKSHESVSILFADVVGFTGLTEELQPVEMVQLLNDVFSFFDSLVRKYQVEKIRTMGDNYMVVAGAPRPCHNHAHRLTRMALEMLAFIEGPENPARGKLQFRIGINSGPVVAGVIGKTKFHYDVWGDTVNVASRMESHGVPGKIQVTTGTRDLLGNEFKVSLRGDIEVKGKGKMETWFVEKEIA